MKFITENLTIEEILNIKNRFCYYLTSHIIKISTGYL